MSEDLKAKCFCGNGIEYKEKDGVYLAKCSKCNTMYELEETD